MATKLALTPAATGTLLFALTAAPTRFREPLLEHLKRYVSTNTIARVITSLKWLFAIGLISDVSSWLSELALNNFRWRSERDRYDWKNEIAVVTGATGGFGSLMSLDLASKNVNVMALDLRDELPENMKGNLKIHYFKCDITDRAAVMDVADQIRKRFGDPSILINNAGIVNDDTILSVSDETVHKVFDVNVLSHYNTVQAFFPAMVAEKKGHVVSIASFASFITTPRMSVYSSSKAAVMALHEGLQSEARAVYNAPEIKFSIVHPTFAATPMTFGHLDEIKASGSMVLDPQVVSDAVVKQIMSGRGGQIVLNGKLGFLANIRGWAHYLRVPFYFLVERGSKVYYKDSPETSASP